MQNFQKHIASLSRAEAAALYGDFDRPTLVLDPTTVEKNYKSLSAGLGNAEIYYAVKANPTKEILRTLLRLGASFDAASLGEIDLCRAIGAAPDRISFGNTIKSSHDIVGAHV